MKKMETPAKQSLGRIIDGIRDGHFVIPDFQREFEWNAGDVTDLLKSIFKDFYVGTLLLWKADRKNVDDLSCEPIYGFEGTINARHIVLDGQQRLSALLYALFAPQKNFPKKTRRCLFFIRIDELLNGNYDDAIYYDWDYKKTVELTENREAQYQEKTLPMQVLSDEDFDYRDWLDEYEKYWKKGGAKTAEEEKKILKKVLKGLLQEYEISFIELDREIEIAKVCDIFTKINSTGVNLNIFDLLNAISKPKGIKLKKMWRQVAVDMSDVLEAKNLLMTMSILKQGYCSASYLYYLVPGSERVVKKEDGSKKKVVLIETKEEFIELWNFVVENLKKTIKAIKNPRDYGAISPNFIPYPSMLLILSALNIEKAKDKYQDKHNIEKKIKQWYWSSVFAKTYSGSTESQIAKDYQEMQRWFEDDEFLPQSLIQSNTELGNLNLLNEVTQSSAIYRAIFNILIMRGAKDWISADKPEYSNLHDHHIVPNSWGKKRIGRNINSILNRTPLSDTTNKDVIGSKLPNVYLKKMFEDTKNPEELYRVLDSHLISKKAVEILLREQFTADDYYEFIKEREESIVHEIRKLIGNISKLEIVSREDPNIALNDLETSLRDFIDDKLKEKIGDDYWKQAIPGHVRDAINVCIQKDITKNPSIGSIENSRRKLDYCDMTHYYPILKHNWNIFKKYFVNKDNTIKHISHIAEYRNSVKHVRGNTEVTKGLGEVSMGWVFSIINPKYVESFKNVKNRKEEIEVPGSENLLTEEELEIIDGYGAWLENRFELKLLNRLKDKKVVGEWKSKGKYVENWYDLTAENKFVPSVAFDKCTYFSGKSEIFICLQVEKVKYKEVIEEILEMPEMSRWEYKPEHGKHFIMTPVDVGDEEKVKSELENAFNARRKIEEKYLKNRDEDILLCKCEGVKAIGKYLPGKEFIVFKGSCACIEDAPSFKGTSGQKLRKKLLDEGILKKENNDSKYLFTKDYQFGSPSAASEVVLGRTSNGWADWMDDNGNTLNHLQGGTENDNLSINEQREASHKLFLAEIKKDLGDVSFRHVEDLIGFFRGTNRWNDYSTHADLLSFKLYYKDDRQITPMSIKSNGDIIFPFRGLVETRNVKKEYVDKLENALTEIFPSEPQVKGTWDNKFFPLRDLQDEQKFIDFKKAFSEFINECEKKES